MSFAGAFELPEQVGGTGGFADGSKKTLMSYVDTASSVTTEMFGKKLVLSTAPGDSSTDLDTLVNFFATWVLE